MGTLQLTQELILLRNGLTAAKSYGVDFENEDEVDAVAKFIANAVTDVDMLLSVDEQSGENRKEAQRSMHLLLLLHTMQCSGSLTAKQKEFCINACASLPVVSWTVYLKCLELCKWADIACECWASTPHTDATVLYKNVLPLVNGLESEFALRVWTFALENMLSEMIKNDSFENHSAVLISSLKNLPAIIDSSTSVEISLALTNVLALLSASLNCDLNGAFSENRSKKVLLEVLVDSSIKLLNNLNWEIISTSLLHALANLHSSLKHSAMCGHCESLTKWMNFLESKQILQNCINNDLSRLIKVIDQRTLDQHAVSQLLNQIGTEETNIPHELLECLEKNTDVLEADHLSRLIAIARNSAQKDYILDKIFRKAFQSWSFSSQESFRYETHKTYGFTDTQLMTSSFENFLTTVVNRLTSTPDKTSVANDLSYLCVQAPKSVLESLFHLTIESGQGLAVAETISYVRSSCKFKSEPTSISFVLTHIECILESNSLSCGQLNNIVAFVQALINNRIVEPSELTSKWLLEHLILERNCLTYLQLLQVAIKSSNNAAIQSVKILPLFILRLSKILHCCLPGHSENTQSDKHIENLREAALMTQIILMKRVDKLNLLKRHEICWLWQQHQNLHVLVTCYLLKLFISNGFQDQCTEIIRRMSLSSLLIARCSYHNYNMIFKEAIINLTCNQSLMPVTAAVVEVLPGISEGNLKTMLSRLADVNGGSDSDTLLINLTIIIDAMILLTHQNVNDIHDIVNSCAKCMKNAIHECKPISLELLNRSIQLIVYLIINVNEPCKAIGKLLILDIVAKRPPTIGLLKATTDAIRLINDPELVTQCNKLTE